MTTNAQSRFSETYCSQCGGAFGAGDSGYSHCEDHRAVDTLMRISGIVNDALDGESPLDRVQRAIEALRLVDKALGRLFNVE